MENKLLHKLRRKGQFFSIIVYVPIITLLITIVIYINWTKFTSDLLWMTTYHELERNGTAKLVLMNVKPLTPDGDVAPLEVDDTLTLYSYGVMGKMGMLSPIPPQPWFIGQGEITVDYDNLSYKINITPIIYSLLPPPMGEDVCKRSGVLSSKLEYWPYRIFYSRELRDYISDTIRFPKSIKDCGGAVFLFNETMLVPTLHTSISGIVPMKEVSWLHYTLLYLKITDEELAKKIVVSKFPG